LAADDGSIKAMTAAVTEVSESMRVLVREEIELAKAEVQTKVTSLLKGVVVGVAAGVFAITGLLFALHGFSWLAWNLIESPPGGNNDFYIGFFVVALVLVALGVVAGLLAFRFVRSGAPPKPAMAIDEARRIRTTVQEARPGPGDATAPPSPPLAVPLAVTDPPPEGQR